MTKPVLPKELEEVRDAARRAINPIKPADKRTNADKDFLYAAKRTNAGDGLPPYYLVYFLLVELLGFKDLGKFEKIAWSVPIDLDGKAYLIEHRKAGVGVFARDANGEEEQAQRIVSLIKRGVRAANPFFKWKADSAVQTSKLNVRNVGGRLFERYAYFRDRFKAVALDAKESEKAYTEGLKQREFDIQQRSVKGRENLSSSELIAKFTFPYARKSTYANWLALAAIDAFFAWTEHIFIHLAILQGRITTGQAVAKTADAEWKDKFKRALDISDGPAKKYLDDLVVLKRQLRNFMAHGAFGKQGEAFSFHSGAGAVPVILDYTAAKAKFSLSPELMSAPSLTLRPKASQNMPRRRS
jgi:hypothetical protein